jgi:hypothetical protein
VAACAREGRLRQGYQDVPAVTQACWGAAHGVVSLFITHGTDPWVKFKDPQSTAYMLIDAVIDGMTIPPAAAGATSGSSGAASGAGALPPGMRSPPPDPPLRADLAGTRQVPPVPPDAETGDYLRRSRGHGMGDGMGGGAGGGA